MTSLREELERLKDPSKTIFPWGTHDVLIDVCLELGEALELSLEKGTSHTMTCGDSNSAGTEPWESIRSPYVCVCHLSVIKQVRQSAAEKLKELK